MSKLSSYVKRHIALEAIHAVILYELKKGEDNLKKLVAAFESARENKKKTLRLIRDSGFKEDECRYVLGNITQDIRAAERLAIRHPEKVACYGDTCLRAAYGLKKGGKLLDVLAVVSPIHDKKFGWFLAECKFEVKTQTGGPFSSEDNFEEVVDRKFEQIQKRMCDDREAIYHERIVLVVSHELQRCLRHLRNMRRGTIDKKIDWTRYELCTINDIIKSHAAACRKYEKMKRGENGGSYSF